MVRHRNNGEDSIYQRKDGRWEAATYVTTPDGTRRRKRVYGGTRDEVAGKLAKLLADEHRGILTATASPKVAEYLDYWLTHVVSQRVRPLTLRSYTVFVREHLIPGLGRKQLHQLTARDVRMFLARARATPSRSPGRKTKPLSDRTVFHLHAVLRNALQDAVREDLIPRNVTKQVRISPGHRDEVQPLSPAEARKFLDAARDDRLYALYAVALSLGLRRAEALGLAWRDIDLDGGTLTVRQTLQRHGGALHLAPPKTKRSRRTIPLLPTMVTTLKAHRERQATEQKEAGRRWRDHGLVFATPLGTPIEPNDFSRAWMISSTTNPSPKSPGCTMTDGNRPSMLRPRGRGEPF